MKDLTPLGAALLCGTPEMIRMLIAAGAQPTSKAFGHACMMGPATNMRAFLDAVPTFDVNNKKSFADMGNTPLHHVAMFGDATGQADKMRLLLDRGAAASVGARNFFGFTPLS